jgi:hypothetical protein
MRRLEVLNDGWTKSEDIAGGNHSKIKTHYGRN